MEENFLKNLRFFTPLTGILVGVLLASFSLTSLSLGLFLLFLGLVIAGFLFFFGEKDGRRVMSFLPLLLFFAGLGVIRFHATAVTLPQSFPLEGNIAIYGDVVREPRLRETYREYIVEAESGVRVLVRSAPFPALSFGDRIVARGALSYPEAFMTEEGRVFDYKSYLHKEGISAIVSFAQSEKVGDHKDSVQSVLFSLKRAFLGNISQAVPYPASSLAGGVLLGSEEALGEDVLDAFRAVGIIHIVVLSGYNITIVAEAILRALTFLGRRKALFISALGIMLFALMVGAGPSVIRASLMGVLVLLARVTGRRYDVGRALVLAASVMVFWNPRVLVFDLGFQLSFLATIAIIWIAPWFEKKFRILPLRFGIRDIAATTVATQLFVLPTFVYASGLVSVSGFLVNLLVLPVIAFLMLTSFITGLLGFISLGLSLIPGLIVYGLGTYVIRLSEGFAALPFSAFTAPPVSGFLVSALYISLFAVWWYMRKIRTKDKTIG